MLRVNTDVLDLPGVIIADRDAASKYARFGSVASILESIDYDLVFAESSEYPEVPVKERSPMAIKCAEVLVPVRVAPDYVIGAYVSGAIGWARLARVAPSLEATINSGLFFDGGPRLSWKAYWWATRWRVIRWWETRWWETRWWETRSIHKRRP